MKNKLLKDSFIFVLGDVLNKAVPFIMLPVLTRYLTPEDYGIISMFIVVVSILAVFTGLSIHGAINVNFFKMERKRLNGFIGNCLLLLNISTFLVFILVLLFYPFFIEKLLIEKEWLFVAIILASAQFLTTINLLLWVAEQRPKPYAIYQLSQTVVTTLLSLLLIVGLGMNWEGQLIATSIATIMFSGISFLFIVNRGYFKIDPDIDHIKDALKFGVPLVPHALSTWVITGADRIIILTMIGSFATGIYSVAYQIGMVISVIVSAFNKVWNPYMFKVLADAPTIIDKRKIVKFTYYYFVFVLMLAFLFSYAASFMIPYILGENFSDAAEYIIYFSFAFAFQGMYFMLTNYILFQKKTHILSVITLISASVHILLLFLLVDLNGAVGAAQATLVSFFLIFCLAWWLSNKVYKMPWAL